jgi:hypothetical protein
MDKRANDYNVDLVRDQLKYLGMLEIIRIRREGYPIHFPFTQFVKRFKIIGKFRTYRPVKDIATLVNTLFYLGNQQITWQPKTKYFPMPTRKKYFPHGNQKIISLATKNIISWQPKNNFLATKKNTSP